MIFIKWKTTKENDMSNILPVIQNASAIILKGTSAVNKGYTFITGSVKSVGFNNNIKELEANNINHIHDNDINRSLA